MANKVTNLDLISSSQAQKEVTANALSDAMSPSALFGRRASTTSGLTFGYYGGCFLASGVPTQIANGSISLTASATNYVSVYADGTVHNVTSAPSGWPGPLAAGASALYQITTDANGVTDYTDYRSPQTGSSGTGITLDTDPTMAANSSTHAPSQSAVVSYVNTKLDGRSWKQLVRAATTTNGTLSTAFANGQVIDGVTLATGDRILIKNQTTGSQNGIYTVNASGSPTRATDADTGAELVNATCYVSEGSANADSQWTCSTNAPITVGSTSLSWVQIGSASGALQAGNNLSDVSSASASRSNLSVYSIAETNAAIAAAGGTPGATSVDLLSTNKPFGTSVSQKSEYVTLAGSATQTIVDYTGSGYVSSFMFAAFYTSITSITAGTINIYIDGSSTPTISMTLDVFFQSVYIAGASAPNKYFNNKFIGANTDGSGVTFFSRLPIPFSTRVKIDIVNGSGSSMTTWSTATIQSGLLNTWPRTRTLKAATALINAPSVNTHQTLLNIIGKGRLIGMWMLQDDYPNSMTPKGASWEGNFRFYIDSATKIWAASTSYSNGDSIIDSNGNKQTVTTAGTTGGSAPTWNQASGGTTSDGSVTWTQTPGTPNQVWIASRSFALNMAVIDSNGYVQRVTTAGTSGASIPSFNSTPGGTTADGSVTWTNQGNTYCAAKYQSSGTEDYFMMGFYGNGLDACFSSNGDIGTTFCSPSPLSGSSYTRSFYRYHIDDPIVFDSQLAITWQIGDSSQVAWASGSPKIWVTVLYYTE